MGRDKIDFGSTSEGNVCWYSELLEGSNSSGDLTVLLQREWKNENPERNEPEGKDKWTKFVKKKQNQQLLERKETWSFWVCSKDCWEQNTSTLSSSAEVLEKERENSWKEVIFYKK